MSKSKVVSITVTPEELADMAGTDGLEWNFGIYRQAAGAIWHPGNSTVEESKVRDEAARQGLRGIAPRDHIEGMLAAQMIACHNVAMECYRRAMGHELSLELYREYLSQANRLSRTHTALVEGLNRHRGKGQQKVTVEHVHVHDGGNAIVGNVSHKGGGATAKGEDQPHEPKSRSITHEPGTEVPCDIEADREAVPRASRQRS